jgi:hypothetical protein
LSMSWVYRGIVWCPWKICLTSLGLSFLICCPKQQSYFGIKRSVREKVEGNVSHQTNPPGDYRLGGTEEEAWGEPWLWSQIQKAVSGSAAPWQCLLAWPHWPLPHVPTFGQIWAHVPITPSFLSTGIPTCGTILAPFFRVTKLGRSWCQSTWSPESTVKGLAV